MLLHITRHGQIQLNTEYCDPDLSMLGRKQASLLGKRLKRMKFNGPIYSSPFLRTLETAQLIADQTGAKIYPASSLREMVFDTDYFTNFSGITPEEAKTRFNSIDKNASFEYPWWIIKEETHEDVYNRAAPFIESILKEGKDCLILGHGATHWAALTYMLNISGYELQKHPPDYNCVLSTFKIEKKVTPLRIMDISHIPPKMITSNEFLLISKK